MGRPPDNKSECPHPFMAGWGVRGGVGARVLGKHSCEDVL